MEAPRRVKVGTVDPLRNCNDQNLLHLFSIELLVLLYNVSPWQPKVYNRAVKLTFDLTSFLREYLYLVKSSLTKHHEHEVHFFFFLQRSSSGQY